MFKQNFKNWGVPRQNKVHKFTFELQGCRIIDKQLSQLSNAASPDILVLLQGLIQGKYHLVR